MILPFYFKETEEMKGGLETRCSCHEIHILKLEKDNVKTCHSVKKKVLEQGE